MKVLQWLATVVFVLAGIALLVAPGSAAVVSKGAVFAPTRFTVVDEGTVGKPDVVMIPGLGSSRASWEAEAKLLAPNYRLHLVQLDGFAGAAPGANAVKEGTSSTILTGVVEELHQYIMAGVMHPAVVGHSLGGLLTLMLADKYPADVSKMVIVDTLPYYAVLFSPTATVDSVKPQAEVMRQQIIGTPDDQFVLMQQMVVPGLVMDKAAQGLVEANDAACDRAVFANAMYEDLQTDLRGKVAGIKTPMLLVYPYDATSQGADPAKVDAEYKDAYKGMPNATLTRIDGSRHFVMYDQPAKLDTALEAYLK